MLVHAARELRLLLRLLLPLLLPLLLRGVPHASDRLGFDAPDDTPTPPRGSASATTCPPRLPAFVSPPGMLRYASQAPLSC